MPPKRKAGKSVKKAKKVKKAKAAKPAVPIAVSDIAYGERPCQKPKCGNGGYYISATGEILCGTHSRKYPDRKILPKNAEKIKTLKAEAYKKHKMSISLAQKENIAQNRAAGQIRVTKLKMFHEPALIPGFVQVWVNNKSKGRSGHPLPQLSPMQLPVSKHGEKVYQNTETQEYLDLQEQDEPPSASVVSLIDLPQAENIENWHQSAKVFPHEVLPGPEQTPTQQYWRDKFKWYAEPQALRHKESLTKDGKGKGKRKPNAPLYSLRSDGKGQCYRFSYLESRAFYCIKYEEAAESTSEFKELLRMVVQEKINVQILGYDGYEVTDLDAHYRDISRPFGHELCVVSLLVHHQNPSERPWHRYIREHESIYRAFPYLFKT